MRESGEIILFIFYRSCDAVFWNFEDSILHVPNLLFVKIMSVCSYIALGLGNKLKTATAECQTFSVKISTFSNDISETVLSNANKSHCRIDMMWKWNFMLLSIYSIQPSAANCCRLLMGIFTRSNDSSSEAVLPVWTTTIYLLVKESK